MDDDLRTACLKAMKLCGYKARQFAERHSWGESARTFRGNIIQAHTDPGAA